MDWQPNWSKSVMQYLWVQVIDTFDGFFNVAALYGLSNFHPISYGSQVYPWLSARLFLKCLCCFHISLLQNPSMSRTSHGNEGCEPLVEELQGTELKCTDRTSVTRKFMTSRFISSFRILTAANLLSHSFVRIFFFSGDCILPINHYLAMCLLKADVPQTRLQIRGGMRSTSPLPIVTEC